MGLGAAAAAIPTRMSLAETSSEGAPLFVGDFETGDTSQYKGIERSGGRRAPEVVERPTRSDGSRFACAYRLEGKQYRCESVPAYPGAPYVGGEGSDLYFGWSVYFAEDFPTAPWQVCGQWHHTNVGGGGRFHGSPPPMAVYVASTGRGAERWTLSNNGQNPWGKGWSLDLGEVPRGEWTDIVVHVKFSSDASNCLVEVWTNGSYGGRLVPPVPTLYPTEGDKPRNSFFKVGYYRHPGTSTPGTVIFDNVKIAGSYNGAITPS